MDFIFDTHAHYNDKAFNEDRTTLLDSFTESGILGVINCGTDIEESKNSIALSENYDFMYCAVGFHPEEIHKANENYLEEIRNLSKHQKCVAIGEIGLDYYWVKDNKEEQKRINGRIRLIFSYKRHSIMNYEYLYCSITFLI